MKVFLIVSLLLGGAEHTVVEREVSSIQVCLDQAKEWLDHAQEWIDSVDADDQLAVSCALEKVGDPA